MIIKNSKNIYSLLLASLLAISIFTMGTIVERIQPREADATNFDDYHIPAEVARLITPNNIFSTSNNDIYVSWGNSTGLYFIQSDNGGQTYSNVRMIFANRPPYIEPSALQEAMRIGVKPNKISTSGDNIEIELLLPYDPRNSGGYSLSGIPFPLKSTDHGKTFEMILGDAYGGLSDVDTTTGIVKRILSPFALADGGTSTVKIDGYTMQRAISLKLSGELVCAKTSTETIVNNTSLSGSLLVATKYNQIELKLSEITAEIVDKNSLVMHAKTEKIDGEVNASISFQKTFDCRMQESQMSHADLQIYKNLVQANLGIAQYTYEDDKIPIGVDFKH